jgi:putative hemolysin
MVISGALLLVAVGILLSAFFSGMETGFYRATRVRLVLDALGGDTISRGLVWLTNHPLLFVATVLVGTNLANYLTALAIVMGTQALTLERAAMTQYVAEMLVPLLLAPLLFVYGELLPKNLSLQAPNRLLRRGGPLFLTFVVLFFPISALLWALNKLLQRLVGQSPEPIRLTLARRELQRLLREGHEVGILHPAQRALAQGIFAAADQPISRFTTPLEQVPRARLDMAKQDILRLAGRYRIPVVPVEAPATPGELAGYVRVIELALGDSDEVGPLHQLLEIPQNMRHVAALMQMQSTRESLARVVNSKRETIGIVTREQLRMPLFHGG